VKTIRSAPANVRLVVFDLDNCLSNDEWRIPTIDFKATTPDARWSEYHAMCHADHPANVETFRNATYNAIPVFITMRPEACAKATTDWIERNLAPSNYGLIMRGDDDHRSSVDIKRDAVLSLPSLPVAAFDDRPDIVEMYKSLGVPAIRLCVHNTCAVTPPPPPEGGTIPLAPPSRGVETKEHFIPLTPKRDAASWLAEAALTYEKRNVEYANSYRKFGAVAAALFPEGLRVRTEEEWNRLGVFMWALSKMHRYAGRFADGGHADSALDLATYAAMLRELTTEKQA
jgi:hypothetical protein